MHMQGLWKWGLVAQSTLHFLFSPHTHTHTYTQKLYIFFGQDNRD